MNSFKYGIGPFSKIESLSSPMGWCTDGLWLHETNVLNNFGASGWADEWAQQRAQATRAVQLSLIEWAMQKNELVSESHSILSVIYTPSVMDL